MAKSRKINQYTLDGEFVKEWLSMSEIQRVLGFRNGDICYCCSGKQKTAFKYQWRYADECCGTDNIDAVKLCNCLTKERCYEMALKCKSRSEFRKRFFNEYSKSLKTGWIDDYYWFEKLHKPRGYWNEEHSYKEAQKYNTIIEFSKKCPAAYKFALDNNLIDKWFERKRTESGSWNNYDKCYYAAINCKTRSEFSDKYPTAYKYSCKNGWLDNFTWFERQANFVADKIHCVYGYFFDELHTVYIGRTNDTVYRDWSHRNTDCPVRRFADKNNVQVPNMLILEKELTRDESLIYEDLYVEQYKIDGWNLINTAKTGLGSGSVGGGQRAKWNRKTCYELALTCNNRTELAKKSSTAYNKSLKYGWMDDYYWFSPSKTAKKWNYDTCREASKDCKNRREFQLKHSGAYILSRKSGWLDEFFPQTKKAA